jgi:hypothetical protein
MVLASLIPTQLLSVTRHRIQTARPTPAIRRSVSALFFLQKTIHHAAMVHSVPKKTFASRGFVLEILSSATTITSVPTMIALQPQAVSM